jgi:hypothetical protein
MRKKGLYYVGMVLGYALLIFILGVITKVVVKLFMLGYGLW